jgi:hypothetical protein
MRLHDRKTVSFAEDLEQHFYIEVNPYAKRSYGKNASRKKKPKIPAGHITAVTKTSDHNSAAYVPSLAGVMVSLGLGGLLDVEDDDGDDDDDDRPDDVDPDPDMGNDDSEDDDDDNHNNVIPSGGNDGRMVQREDGRRMGAESGIMKAYNQSPIKTLVASTPDGKVSNKEPKRRTADTLDESDGDDVPFSERESKIKRPMAGQQGGCEGVFMSVVVSLGGLFFADENENQKSNS